MHGLVSATQAAHRVKPPIAHHIVTPLAALDKQHAIEAKMAVHAHLALHAALVLLPAECLPHAARWRSSCAWHL